MKNPEIKSMHFGAFITTYITVPCNSSFVHIWAEKSVRVDLPHEPTYSEYSFTVKNSPTLFLDDTFTQVTGEDQLAVIKAILSNVMTPCSLRIFDPKLNRRFKGLMSILGYSVIYEQHSSQFNSNFTRYIIKKK